MTRKEKIALLINELEDIRCNDYDSGTVADKTLKEAIGVIKASKQEENCEDAISRQAVLDIAKSSKSNWIDNSVLFKRVNELPPVTPQQKMGHWIRVTDKSGHLVWECDKCGWQQRFNTNFCPDCGARMMEDCDTCKHKDEEWNSEHCNECCSYHSGFEPQERSE